MFERPRTGERAVLVRLGLGAPVDPEDLQEFTQLARSAGAHAGRDRHRPARRAPIRAIFMGSGKAEELRELARATEADVILVDHALSPSQERNLEKLTERRVLDRNGLILDIFAQRARSFEGKLEVELAQLKHIASRLVRGWTHLERQKGGIGLRGPGETQLETDRRIIGQRVRVLTQAAGEDPAAARDRAADARRRSRCPRWRSSATPTPANRRCSARSRARTPTSPTSCSPRSIPRCGASRLPGRHAGRGRRHRGLHPRAAARAGGRVPVHPDRGARGDAAAARRGCQQPASRRAASRRSMSVLERDRRRARSRRSSSTTRSTGSRSRRASIATPRGARTAVWISAEQRLGTRAAGRRASPSAWRASRAARAVRVPASAGALRSRLYAAQAVRAEQSADDGSIELAVELPDVELLELARTAGVQILEVQGPDMPCAAAEPPTYNRRPLRARPSTR